MAIVADRLTVIVIEDDEGMREAIESLLGAAGLTALSWPSAEALLDSGVPAGAGCVVSDIYLGAISGFDLIDELRRRGADLPVILITAHDSPWTRAEASRLGAAAYLPKPFVGSVLLGAIAQASAGGARHH